MYYFVTMVSPQTFGSFCNDQTRETHLNWLPLAQHSSRCWRTTQIL